jgi:galactose mutarotase-like enzyme
MVTRASISRDQTAQLELTVKSQGEEPTEVLFGNAIPFNSDQRSNPNGTLLLPASQNFERKNQQTWLPAPEEDIIGPGGVAGKDFESGETLTTDWSVWGDPDHVAYIEPGTYEFENSVTIESTDDQIPWTLTVTVET